MHFSPLHNPIPPSSIPALFVPSGVAFGQRLCDEVTEIYTWFISSWYTRIGTSSTRAEDETNEAIRKALSHIKRIAHVSLQGGAFLSEGEELWTIERLKEIIEAWNGGEMRKQELPHAFHRLIAELTGPNPKAKVVFQATELEYRLCLNPPLSQSPQLTDHYREVLAGIIQKVTPSLHDVHASGLSQGLSKILDNSSVSQDLSALFQEAVKRWI
jgi:hypothetical protein